MFQSKYSNSAKDTKINTGNVKTLMFRIPMSICNFRCHYCYLAQRDECYQGVMPSFKYTPQEVAKALSKERLGGACFMNFCADGETLLTKDLRSLYQGFSRARPLRRNCYQYDSN